jgi:hypothetical protein
MKTHLFFSVVVMVAVNVSCSGNDAKMSTDAEKTAKQLQGRIASELKASPHHPWAGEYYAGDGLGVNMSLDLAPKSGFVFEWHGCMGLYDRNYGAVDSANGSLHLSFTFENKRQGFEGIAPDLIPVLWGDRRYLVPADDVIGFCNDVNEGSEPRNDMHGSYLLRSGDEKKRVSGLPTIPNEFQRYLVSKPIAADIIFVGAYKIRRSAADWEFKDTSVILNAGSINGLRPGMELLVVEPTNKVESVRITKVEENQSEASMRQIGENEPGPKVGWRFSTRDPWKDLKNESK